MSRSTMARLLAPSFALSLALAITVAAQAQNRHDQMASGTAASLQINFGSAPRWRTIRGTNIREISGDQRPDYDMFRYGGNYYAYCNDRWYRSRRDRGEFMWIEDRYVPSQFTRVPRDHWRNYPAAWTDEHGNSRYGRRGNDRGHGYGKGKGDDNGHDNGKHHGNGKRH